MNNVKYAVMISARCSLDQAEPFLDRLVNVLGGLALELREQPLRPVERQHGLACLGKQLQTLPHEILPPSRSASPAAKWRENKTYGIIVWPLCQRLTGDIVDHRRLGRAKVRVVHAATRDVHQAATHAANDRLRGNVHVDDEVDAAAAGGRRVAQGRRQSLRLGERAGKAVKQPAGAAAQLAEDQRDHHGIGDEACRGKDCLVSVQAKQERTVKADNSHIQ